MAASVTIIIDDANSTITQLNQVLGTYMGGSYKFTVSGAAATVGATYTVNSQTFTVVKTIVSGDSILIGTSQGSPTLTSGTLTKASGTGDSTIAYTAVMGTFDVSNLCNAAINYLAKCASGGVSASTLQVAIRDTDPGVNTSGTSSTSVTVSIG